MSFRENLARRVFRWWHDRQVRALRESFAACGVGLSLDLPAVIRGTDRIRIGSRVSINAYAHFWGQGGITIGDDCLIASHVTITSLTHDIDAPRFRDSLIQKPVVLEDNVWIGSHATILPGVTIGRGAVVGAGAVVTKNVPPRAVVVGVPARVQKILPDRPTA
jgi:maltose O-acetyltransferase